MKRLIAIIVICACAVSVSLSAERSSSDTSSHDRPSAVSNHSVSLQVLGLEYGYEQKLGGSFTMVFRAGLVPAGSMYYGDYFNMSLSFRMKPGVSIEPRYYTNFVRRTRLGKSTYRNTGDFVSVKVQGSLGGSFLLGSNEDGSLSFSSPVDVSVTPMYGIRRMWGRLWFGEFSAGVRVGWQSLFYVSPYLQCRIGLSF